MCLNPNRINGILNVFTDEGERCFVNLLGNDPEHRLKIDPRWKIPLSVLSVILCHSLLDIYRVVDTDSPYVSGLTTTIFRVSYFINPLCNRALGTWLTHLDPITGSHFRRLHRPWRSHVSTKQDREITNVTPQSSADSDSWTDESRLVYFRIDFSLSSE